MKARIFIIIDFILLSALPLYATGLQPVVEAWRNYQVIAGSESPGIVPSGYTEVRTQTAVERFSSEFYKFISSREFRIAAAHDERWSACSIIISENIDKIVHPGRYSPYYTQWTARESINNQILLLTSIDEKEDRSTAASYFILFSVMTAVVVGLGVLVYILFEEMHRMQNHRALMYQFVRDTVEASEEERARVSKELHSSVFQNMRYYTFLAVRLASSDISPEDREKSANELEKGMQSSMTQLLDICDSFVPPDFEHSDLVGELENLCRRETIRSKVSCRFMFQPFSEPPHFTPEEKLGMYRVVQEGIMTAVNHAHPREIVVAVEITEGTGVNQALICYITDDGTIPDGTKAVGKSIEYRSMRERARLIGARVSFSFSKESGNRLKIEMPLL